MSKFYKQKFYIFYFSFLFCTCNFINFEEIKISSNINSKKLFFNEEYIKIDFSIPPEKNSVEKILILKEDNSRIDFFQIWNENFVYIKPKENWKQNAYYEISLNGNIQTKDNRNYEVDFKNNFYYGRENNLFFLESKIFPSNKNECLILNFNKQINIFDFEKNFSISPYTKIKYEYQNNNKSVKIFPEDFWQANIQFSYTLKEFLSEDKIKLNREYHDFFLPNGDLIIPKIISVECLKAEKNSLNSSSDFNLNNIDEIEIMDSIGFNFNKKIDLTSFENSFSIQPKTQGHFWQKDKTIFFTPSKNFNIEQKYFVTIKKTVSDLNNLNFIDDYKFSFIPQNSFLKITSFKINKSENLKLFSESKNLTFGENTPEIDFSSINKIFIKIDFSKEIYQDSKKEIEKIILVEPFFPQTLSVPKLEKINWISEKEVVLQFSNFSINKNYDCFYKFKISNAKNIFQTVDQEYLEENLCTIFKVK